MKSSYLLSPPAAILKRPAKHAGPTMVPAPAIPGLDIVVQDSLVGEYPSPIAAADGAVVLSYPCQEATGHVLPYHLLFHCRHGVHF